MKTDALTRRDWRLPLDARGVDSTDLPSLRCFELSTTAFGKPCADSIRALLANSRETLSSLTFRNKAASEETLKAFRLVAADVMQEAAPGLQELAIIDLPRHRNSLTGSSPCRMTDTSAIPDPGKSRLAGESAANAGWWPSKTLQLPRLRRLHLVGYTNPDPDFFTRTIAVTNQQADEPIQIAFSKS